MKYAAVIPSVMPAIMVLLVLQRENRIVGVRIVGVNGKPQAIM
jgi:hypothetical protein